MTFWSLSVWIALDFHFLVFGTTHSVLSLGSPVSWQRWCEVSFRKFGNNTASATHISMGVKFSSSLHVLLLLLFFNRSYYVVQAAFELLSSVDPPASASLVAAWVMSFSEAGLQCCSGEYTNYSSLVFYNIPACCFSSFSGLL